MEEKVIIINEFLTFVQNKVDVLDELSIVQICVTSFTAEEIESGKTELFNALVSEGVKYIQRKGEDKSKKSVRDVIKAFKETEPTRQPTFVAKDLNRLPPVSFDHVDVTRLLKDIVILKNELQSLRQDSVSKAEMFELQRKISSDITSLKGLSNVVRQNQPQVQGSKAGITSAKSKKSRRAHDDTYSNVLSTRERGSSVETIVDAALPVLTNRDIALDDCTVPTVLASDHTPEYRDIVHKGNETQLTLNLKQPSQKVHNTQNVDSDFTVVQRKKRTSRNNLCGTAQRACTITVADIPAYVYVSRLAKSTTTQNMLTHIQDMGQECIEVQLLNQKYETSFNSFKIKVSRSKLEHFLKSSFWPAGVKYRVFREHNNAKTVSTNH